MKNPHLKTLFINFKTLQAIVLLISFFCPPANLVFFVLSGHVKNTQNLTMFEVEKSRLMFRIISWEDNFRNKLGKSK